MRKLHLMSASAAVLTGALFMTGAAFAQQQNPASPASPTQPTTPAQPAPVQPRMPETMQDSIGQAEKNPLEGVDLATLIDMNVTDSAGESIGDVNDIVLDAQGQPSALIIGTGGILGVAEREVKVDASEVTLEQGDGAVQLISLTSAQVEKLPTYAASDTETTYRNSKADKPDTAPAPQSAPPASTTPAP
ncbi:MAG: PRC-barrel domain-containing protein [Alphaproteobacteria bacterium]|nr:PRC-barrel domain-containing protein [Alphaproteobacteria bacterium]